MPASAANPATFLHLLLRMVEQANQSPSTRNKGGGLRSSYGVSVRPKKAAIRVTTARMQMRTMVRLVSLKVIPARARSLLRACPAPGGTALFCFGCAALRVTVSTFGGPTVNAELGAWELGLSLGSARCDPSKIGNSKTETPSCIRTK
jgi:hypothetical protein